MRHFLTAVAVGLAGLGLAASAAADEKGRGKGGPKPQKGFEKQIREDQLRQDEWAREALRRQQELAREAQRRYEEQVRESWQRQWQYDREARTPYGEPVRRLEQWLPFRFNGYGNSMLPAPGPAYGSPVAPMVTLPRPIASYGGLGVLPPPAYVPPAYAAPTYGLSGGAYGYAGSVMVPRPGLFGFTGPVRAVPLGPVTFYPPG